MPAGRALDLGCGYGRAAIYLAQRGWQVDGVDFIERALVEAQRRSSEAGVTVSYHHGSVTDLSFLEPPYDLALDVGCGHNLDRKGWQAYHAGLRRLLRPGALFMLFSRLLGEQPAPEAGGPGGLDEEAFLRLFAEGFDVERRTHGETVMPDGSWTSAWYWLRRAKD
jgi:cyclopropane fatty-acyl-phospholipid synthase-like methyltransferase